MTAPVATDYIRTIRSVDADTVNTLMTDITSVRSKINDILNEGALDGAAAKLNRLIETLRPFIRHLPTFEAIERHLLGLVANNAVVNPQPGKSDKDWQKDRLAGDRAAEDAANQRSQKALHIIRGYIRLREALKAAGKEDLQAHMDSLAALKKSSRFDHQYVDAIFHP